MTKEKSAGSGSLASLGHNPLDISNPRVLSDMGLAIPRPTRFPPALAGLGDPRALSGLFEIIISFCSVANPCPKGHVASIASHLLV
jgi:hypothetical protein